MHRTTSNYDYISKAAATGAGAARSAEQQAKRLASLQEHHVTCTLPMWHAAKRQVELGIEYAVGSNMG